MCVHAQSENVVGVVCVCVSVNVVLSQGDDDDFLLFYGFDKWK